MEAVLVAVEAMERNRDAFNAGIGGSPNRDGEVELDACVMRGADGSAGAVAAVSAKALAERYAAGGSLPALMTRALDEVRGFEGKGGLIAISAEGEIAHAFDTANLAVAWTDGSQALVAVLEQPERER